jgi:alpha-L-arabinofuranosidase
MLFAAAGFLAASGASAQTMATANVNIQADQPGATVSSNLFGIFFEEINFAGEGGLYAELVRNRCFDNSTNPDYWTLVTTGTAAGQMSVDTTHLLNTNRPHCLNLTMQSGTGTVGAGNNGFWGMSLQSGTAYNLNFYALASNGFSGAISAQLQNSNGAVIYAQSNFTGVTTNWQHFTASLVSSGTDTNARLVLSISQPGTVWLNVVSLFPPTFDNRTNGLRPDLANLLVNLDPAFMRFPGGGYIVSWSLTNAFQWKNSIGDIALRPGHYNDTWGYWSTDGLGYHEYLQLCEDLGAEPLFVINCGLSGNANGSATNTVPLDEMGPWVQNALDAIQYANGATNTTWGALRAANGHPAPFNLNYMEIGNENSGSYYNDRYALFYNAIKSNYPSIHLIANDQGSIPTSAPVEIQDEHYYESASTLIGYATKYDSYSRSGPKVFVGEYATYSGYGTYGNLSAALGEASFMTGMERNSDIVQLASYAPLFANVNDMQWHPDLINFNNHQVFGTPSYYVQQMFSQNRGDLVLPVSVTTSNTATNIVYYGGIGVGSWNTAVQYTNISVTSNGVTLYQSDFVHQGTNGWNVYNGTWSVANGVYQQTAITTDCYSTSGSTNWANYTITLSARKVSGNEGFLILFDCLDNNDLTWWNVGGWNNTLDGIEQMVAGNITVLAQVSQTAIATNTWYNLKIVLNGPVIQCYLNNTLVQTYTNTPAASTLLASTTYSRSSGQIIVKAVNPGGNAVATTFNLAGVGSINPAGTLIQLTSSSAANENSLANPTNVSQVTNSISNAGTNFTLTLPANSLSILRLQASGISFPSNLVLQVPSPIYSDESVAATVEAEHYGVWTNLTANTNHAITYSSANTAIATVDNNGNVTGVASGTTSIIATYTALGLTATQSVQVIYVPTTLAHRYSFSETSGTSVADSIGGAAWNGTLPNGGALGGGQLTFSSASQQYLSLPGGILSNYPATTIEMWIPGISGSTTSPPYVYLFSFGDTDSGGAGYDYVFFNPNLARATISAADPGYNGEQGGNLASSLGTATNLHLTCVFDCPAGVIDIYTNGVLASAFAGITDPLSTVGNEYAYIGRSLYTSDSYLTWTIDELRIYDGALLPAEIAATQALGPNQLLSSANPTVGAVVSGGNVTLSWPLASAGYTVLTTTNLVTGNWTTAIVTPQIVGSQWQVILPATNAAQFFQLQK